ncbi:uncharacterized protein LOC123397201 [Hordeum vulgare subsp. vulgare]|uniref:uncharacterized protein LOC123397201 n=1 Tax=Hordeum vulgare subsp. vulgare TaxID=112509 RepID=UPI001D1A3952|nr:uncharacterized protein LOC123397201 [Hordeum vulgare subsp. vulgare]
MGHDSRERFSWQFFRKHITTGSYENYRAGKKEETPLFYVAYTGFSPFQSANGRARSRLRVGVETEWGANREAPGAAGNGARPDRRRRLRLLMGSDLLPGGATSRRRRWVPLPRIEAGGAREAAAKRNGEVTNGIQLIFHIYSAMGSVEVPFDTIVNEGFLPCTLSFCNFLIFLFT